MEAIKCPNCGSEKVQELTEEKYVCLACDNVFLVHNLSKEFRKTDEHITGVHEDLSKKIDKLSKSVENTTIGFDGSNMRAKEILFEAEEALNRGQFAVAYTEFKRYTTFVPDSYVGYEGMFRALTNNYNNYWGIDVDTKDVNCLLEGTDVLREALMCEDCPKEEILNKYRTYYSKFAEIITYVSPEDLAHEKERKEELFNNTSQNLSREIQKLEELQNDYSAKSCDVDNYESMSTEDYKKGKMRALRRTIILFIITILLWNSLHIIFKIVLVVILLILISGLFRSQSEDLTSRKKDLEEINSKLNEQKRKVQMIKNSLTQLEDEMKKESEVQSEITNDYVESLIMNVDENVSGADVISRKYLKTQGVPVTNNHVVYASDTEEQMFIVELTEVGSDSVSVIKMIREITGLGLKEAKDLVNEAPVEITQVTDMKKAKDIKGKMESVGAVVSVLPANKEVVNEDSNATQKFVVELTGVGSDSVSVIKMIREITGLGLKEAKDLVNEAPVEITQVTDMKEAKDIKSKLESVGATVTVK